MEDYAAYAPWIVMAFNGLIAGWLASLLLGGGGIIRDIFVGVLRMRHRRACKHRGRKQIGHDSLKGQAAPRDRPQLGHHPSQLLRSTFFSCQLKTSAERQMQVNTLFKPGILEPNQRGTSGQLPVLHL